MNMAACRRFFQLIILMGALSTVWPQGSVVSKSTILWDSSLSMKDRDLEKEFNFLEEYFSVRQDVLVTLVFFSNDVLSRENFTISSGQWGLLKQRLAEALYDGGTSYVGLSEFAEGEDILLFTDGHHNVSNESPYFLGNVLIINSKSDHNRANLNLLAILSKGTFINLVAKQKKDTASKNQYFGVIHGTEGLNYKVEIAIKGREEEVIRPATDGSYTVEAKDGEVLVVSTTDGNRIERPLGKNKNIDIWISNNNEIMLEEIVLAGVKEEPAEEKITAYGNRNKDGIGYAVQSIDDKQISDVSTTVNNATQGKFSGMRLGQNDDLSQVILRPSNSILGNNYGLIVVDGVALKQSNSATGDIQSTTFLDPKNIADITVLKGLAATNRFGSMGANGVILIRTKTGTFDEPKEKKDLAILNDNIYEGKLKVSAKTLVTPYLKALKKAKNLKEAYNIYLAQREQYATAPAFYIDVFEYFLASSKPIATRVLTNVLEDRSLKYNTLRAVLLKCQQREMPALELATASAILERHPDKVQSYFDYALALDNNGAYQESLDQLLKISDGSINTELDFSVLKKSVDAEIKNLIYNQDHQLNLAKVPAPYKNNLRYNARIIFDWNYPSAEFELQFVNPQKRFFTWEHITLTNGDRIQQEWDYGFSREEFEIVGQETLGEWLINVKYHGNANTADLTPTFLKCLVQYNFGKPDQKETVYMIRLHEKDTEEQLAKLIID